MTRTHEIKLDGYGAHTTLAEDRPIMLLGTAESYGIEMLHVVSGKSWEGLTVTATFNAPDGTSTDMLMDADGSITVPPEATAKSGSGRIVFTGVSNRIQRISCDLEYFVVAHSAINGVQSGGVAPSWFEQAVTRFVPAGGTAGQVLTKLTNTDFDAEWQDNKGGADGKSAYSYAQEGGYTGTEAEFAVKLAADKLPNPYPLTFTGAVSETYDGSSAKTIEIPSGGSGAHSDWNQNDSTAADYIKNRPFYTGDPVETVLVEESTVPFTEQGGLYMAGFESTFVPTVGEVYKVSWDGTVYECTCVDFHGNTLIGNLSITGAGSDTGEPFIMAIYSGRGMNIGTLDTSASHTFSISGFVSEVVKIDEKYLPDVLTTKMNNTNPTGSGSFSLNRKANTTIGVNSFAEGNETTASGFYSHAEGDKTTASGENSHAEGCSDHVYSVYITAESPTNEDIITTWKKIGNGFSVAKGNNSHVEGDNSLALGEDSHAEGCKTIASGLYSHAEGYKTIASGSCSHAEGNETTASGLYSHAEGYKTIASGSCSHAEGNETTASGEFSHAECNGTTASGNHSHAEGVGTTASGGGSHAEGYKTIASSNYQHVQGQYNIEDSSGTYADIVGNGSINSRSNAYTLDWKGNAWYSGTIEGKALILPSSTAGSTKKFKITVDDSGTISATEMV